jgi:serine/threonine protein kinase
MSDVVDAAPSLASSPGPLSGAEHRVTELPHVGEVIGRYALRALIGAGGMGTVYEAEHLVLQKRVALKVLNPELAAFDDLRQRFVREGLAASRVRHPHVVDVTDAAEENGRAYLVMELLEGHGLDVELAKHGRLDIARASEIILPICAALSEAHAVGVVHRDMKPENVLLVRAAGDRVVPKVVDFGISDLIGGSWGNAGVVVGTPHYMAPEQATGEPVDGLADQYAVGVMLFELLTGILPYDLSRPKDTQKLMADVAAGRTRRLSEVLPDAPERLDAVIARAMHPDPRRRFRTMERFGRALLPLASPRAVRRYRDLVDPGWSALFPAVTAMMLPPENDLASPPEAPSTLPPVSEAPSVPPPAMTLSRLADPFAPPVPRSETATVDQTWRRPVMDTIASPPPDLSGEPIAEGAGASRPRTIVSSSQTLRWSSVPPPRMEEPRTEPPRTEPPRTEPPRTEPRPRAFTEPPPVLAAVLPAVLPAAPLTPYPADAVLEDAPVQPRDAARIAAITAGALVMIASLALAAVVTTFLS